MTINNNPPWRPEEVEKLHELWNHETRPDAKRIGELIGRPRNSVLGRVFRMRAKEGEERWPMHMRPVKPKRIKRIRHAKQVPEEVSEKIIVPALPDRVTEAYGSRCHWTDCAKPKNRGHYCADHARVMYQPQKDTRRWWRL